MFTRCPNCRSTFRVTAAILQMAEGDVSCGACGTVFNALRTLVDDPTAGEPLPADATTRRPAEAAGSGTNGRTEEALEFDVPEDEWQRFFITQPAAAPAHAERTEPGLGDDFDLPAGSFDDAGTSDETQPLPEVAAGPASPKSAPRPTLEEETADADAWQAFLHEVEADAGPGDDGQEEAGPAFVVADERPPGGQDAVLVRRRPDDAAPEDAPAATGAPIGAQEPIVEEITLATPAPTMASPAAGSRHRATVLDWEAPPQFPLAATDRPARSTAWLAASLLAALVLAGQALYHYRDRLAADPAYGPTVRAAAQRIGLALHPAWPVEAYEIRGAKAIADNSAPGALDIVAEIAVTGSQPVGLPMVRVVLRDRWSNIVASGVFPASRYLAGPLPPSQLFAPGSLIPVQITLKDPGASAQGYELDVCMPSRTLGLHCKAMRDPFRS